CRFPAPEPQPQRTQRQQQRHQSDIQELQGATQGLDIGIEVVAHLAQLLAYAQLLLHEALQRGLLFGRQLQALLRVGVLQLGQLRFGFGQTVLQNLLLLAETILRLTLQRFYHHERTRRTPPRAHADQRIAARQVIQRIDNEVAIVRPGLRQALAEKVLHVHPHAIAEQIGIGYRDDVDAGAFLEAILTPLDAVRIGRLRRALDRKST